jgi:hypothetical protein
MNSETKRKFCGLIMFDVPIISMKSKNNNDDLANNNNNNNTRDINPSSYESLNNISGPPINHHNPIFIQHNNNINSDFSTTSQALAAGAAASEEDFNSNNNYSNNGNNNNDDNDHCDNNGGKMTQQKRTPRPPNAFILYRRAKQPAIIAAQRHLTNAEVSRQISDMWRNETEEVRLNWERYADRKKLEHMQIYPNYVYRPNKNKSKVDKRRQRRQTSMSSAKELASIESSPSVSTNDDNNKSNAETNGSTGPMRRKSKNNKVPIKVEINPQMAYDIINGYNMQSRQLSDSSSSNNNYASSTPTPTTATPTTASAILPSPLLASQYTDVHNHHQQQQEFVPSQNASTHTSPLTPITPPRQQAMICNNEFKFRQQPQQLQQQHDRQYQNNMLTYVPSNEGGINHPMSLPITFAPNASFNGLTTFHQASEEYHPHQSIDPLLCFVPDVAQQQQQMLAEMMLHEQHPHQHQHHQHHHHNPDSSPASSDIQYYETPTTAVDATVNGVLGNHHSFTDMLAGLEFQNHYLTNGSVNHGNNGLAANQQQYLH